MKFCSCGSIMMDEHCTNKNCANKSDGTAKKTKSKRQSKRSKVKTYNLNSIKEDEN